MTTLYKQVQPISITTSPFNISNFQLNTFECNAGSNIINLPSYVVVGNSFTIINNDSTSKIINDNSFVTELDPNQSVIFIGNIISNLWEILKVDNTNSKYDIIGTSGNTPKATTTGIINLTKPLVKSNGYYYFKSSVILFTTNYSVGVSTISTLFNPITIPGILSEIYLFTPASTVSQFSFLILNENTISYSTSLVNNVTGYNIDIYQI